MFSSGQIASLRNLLLTIAALIEYVSQYYWEMHSLRIPVAIATLLSFGSSWKKITSWEKLDNIMLTVDSPYWWDVWLNTSMNCLLRSTKACAHQLCLAKNCATHIPRMPAWPITIQYMPTAIQWPTTFSSRNKWRALCASQDPIPESESELFLPKSLENRKTKKWKRILHILHIRW